MKRDSSISTTAYSLHRTSNSINYCNKVLAHGEETIARDESFSRGDWLPIRAEMITLRAFCHYYLLRTFGEVPYVTFDYNNDSQDFLIAQSTQIQVLDSIIKDLESIKADAMNDYGNTVQNAGRVTLVCQHGKASTAIWNLTRNQSSARK